MDNITFFQNFRVLHLPQTKAPLHHDEPRNFVSVLIERMFWRPNWERMIANSTNRMIYLTKSLSLLIATLLMTLSSAPIHAKETKYAAYIIHADSGDILFDRYSTQYRYPASLTKMMTLYLLFEELEAGRMTLKSKLKVSKKAAGQPPSKLGVRSGSTITVETAIKALIVKSANDVAVVVAERIDGAEWKFAKHMTQRARQIGMRKTTFKNASGLPNSKQLTTARDMAELSRRLFQDFPQYKHYFSTKQFSYKSRTYTTHNSLVKNYPGADGIKTGYTRRSGYNLATSAERDDNKLIGIVLGGRSGYTRDKHMREILDKAFATLKRKPQLISALHRNTPTPNLKPSPYADAPTLAGNEFLQASLHDASKEFAHSDPVGSLIAANGERNTPNITLSVNNSSNDELARLIHREDNSYVTAQGDTDDIGSLTASITGRSSASAVSEISPSALPWTVQIGAYSTQKFAKKELEKAAKLASLRKTPRNISTLLVDNKPTLFRARFFYENRSEAHKACDILQNQGIGCFVAANGPKS